MTNQIINKTDSDGKNQQVIRKTESKSNEDYQKTIHLLGDSFVLKLKELEERCNLTRERLNQIEKRALLLLQPFPSGNEFANNLSEISY